MIKDKIKTKVRRIITTKTIHELFNKEVEFIEYFDNPGIFYQIGYPNIDKVGLDVNWVENYIGKSWYNELPGVSHTKTTYYNLVSKKYISELKKIKGDLSKLNKRRYEIHKILGIDTDSHFGISG